MSKLIARRAIALLFVVASVVSARAEGILDHVPPDATGFVVIRDLAGADAKIQKLMDIFAGLSDAKPPAPLAFIKTATGLGAGINESGDALLATLPGDGSPLEPKPLLVVSVSDYAAFAGSVGGDASGEISRVRIVGQEVLAAKRGDYAVLMNVEHRPTLEALIAAEPQASETVAALGDWLGANDVALVLLPAGVDLLTATGQQAIADQTAQMEQQFSGAEMKEMLDNAKRSLELYQKVLGFLGTEVSAAAVGLAIDDSTNVRLTDRVVFERSGRLGNVADVAKLPRHVLAGYADKPFVFAGGGPFPKEWGEAFSKWLRTVIEQSPETYGFEEFDEAKWNKLEESWRGAMQMRSLSMIMFAGEKDDPLYSNVFGVVDMEDATTYMEAAKKSMTTWNELAKDSTSDIKLDYEVADVEIAGKPSLQVTNDILAAAGDDNVPMVAPMFKAMFGGDGKLRFYLVPADDDTIVTAIATEKSAAAAVEALNQEDDGLAKSEHVLATEALLNPAAPWTGYVSPAGCVAWAERLIATFSAVMGGGVTPTIPPYPAGPPVGFSMNITGGQLHGEMAIPVKAMEDLAAYIKKVEGL